MTKDNGMDVSPSWQELKEERDALISKVEARNRLLRQREERISALAAQWETLLTRVPECNDCGWHEKVKREQVEAAKARIKAEWQAEALLAAAPEMVDPHDRARLERFARAVIRQPKEPRP